LTQGSRHVFRSSEDFLTATTFERLAYLDDATCWRVLQQAAKPELLPFRTVATLEQIEFWPRWPLRTKDEERVVEPDVFLRFSVGDPATRVALIVEAKLGGFQSAEQWAREWHAYQHNFGDTGGEVVLVALGGLEKRAASVAELADRANRELARLGLAPQLRAASLSWLDLVAALADLLETGAGASVRRILSDIIEALALHGYRRVKPVAELPAAARAFLALSARSADALSPRLAAAGTFADVSHQGRPEHLSNWLTATEGLRPIASTGFPLMGPR
jgi:hypothetical protein